MTQKNNELEIIASFYLGIETLEIQNNDDLDFHDVLVINIKEALKAAYEAGKAGK